MSYTLRLGLIIVSLLLLIIVLVILKKGRMPVKYSLIWIFSSLLILLVGLVPNLFKWISNLFGFVTMSNLIIGIFIFILLMITISLTVITSGQKRKTTLLIQEVSMLKTKMEKFDEKN